jgi:hypothetical protein
VNIGSAELLFALVNVHCWIVYEVFEIGAPEIKWNKTRFSPGSK